MKKRLSRVAAIVLCCSMVVGVTALADDDYRKPTRISAETKTSVSMKVNNYRYLEVDHNGNENYLSWSVTSGKNVVRIASADKTDDEVRIKALKKGTAKVTCKIKGTSKKVTYTVKVKSNSSAASKKIYRVTAKNVTIERGDDRDLKVRKGSAVHNRDLKWSITGEKGIVGFDDNDLTDDDVEIYGKKIGSTTVTCTNRLIDQKLKFNVTVVADDGYDDDDDYDDYYDD